MAKPLLEVLRDVSLDPTERAAFAEDPSHYMAQHGYEDVPAEDLSEAFGLVHDTLPAETALQLTQDPVFELPGEPGTLEEQAAEVGDLAPFGEVNGDFDAAAGEDLDDVLDDVVTEGIGDGIDDDGGVGRVDDGSLDDDALEDLGEGLGPAGGAGEAPAIDDLDDDLDDAAGSPATGDLGDLGDLDLAFGIGSAGGGAEGPSGPGDPTGDPAGGDLDDAALDDVDALDLASGGVPGIGEPLGPGLDTLGDPGSDLDALGGDDLDDDLGLMFDDTPGVDDLPEDVGDIDDIGSF